METVRFEAIVGQEQVIRPPKDIALPQGAVEVIVCPLALKTTKTKEAAATRAWMLALAAEAEQAAPDLPSDLAEHHDHYAHGKPLS